MSKHWTEVAQVDSSVVAIPPFRIDVPVSSERVGFGAQTPRAEVDDEIELGEVLGPTGLSTGKDFGSREIFQVLVVHDHVDWSTGTFKEVSPDMEGFKDGKEFLIMSIVVEFRSTEGVGVEGHRVDFSRVSFNRQDGSESIIGGIGLNNDRSVQDPMGQDVLRFSFLVPFLSPFVPLHFSIFSLNFLLFHLHSLTVHT